MSDDPNSRYIEWRQQVEIIARLAEPILLQHFERLEAHQIERKTSVRDLVTVADTECERLVVQEIHKRFPDHGILGEEHGSLNADHSVQWVIDPVDGTTNYARGFPFYAISIGILEQGAPVAACVLAPTLREIFSASRGGGATRNGQPIRVSAIETLDRSLLATGFSYNRNQVARNNVDNIGRLALKSHDIRRPGAASLDLCYVACGRFDGYWEAYLAPWDICAGALIVQEAGGLVTDFSGNPSPDTWLWHENAVATNGSIHDALLAELSGTEPGYQPRFGR